MGILYNIYVKGRPVSRHIKKPGGFPPSPPKVTKFDTDGSVTDESHMQWCIYRRKYKQWKKYLLPFEEVFGVKFNIIIDEGPDWDYLNKKRKGLLEPLNIKPVQHPLDDIIG